MRIAVQVGSADCSRRTGADPLGSCLPLSARDRERGKGSGPVAPTPAGLALNWIEEPPERGLLSVSPATVVRRSACTVACEGGRQGAARASPGGLASKMAAGARGEWATVGESGRERGESGG